MQTPYEKWLYPNLAERCERAHVAQRDIAKLLKVKPETIARRLQETGLPVKWYDTIREEWFAELKNNNWLFQVR